MSVPIKSIPLAIGNAAFFPAPLKRSQMSIKVNRAIEKCTKAGCNSLHSIERLPHLRTAFLFSLKHPLINMHLIFNLLFRMAKRRKS
jgi:hypothetical protein